MLDVCGCCWTLLLLLLALPVLSDELDNPPVLAAPADRFDADKSQHRIRVALVDSGVNYQLPLINQHLARDDDGALIGYDFWDMDALPFDSHPTERAVVQRHGTRTASILIREAPFAELVPYRYPRPDMNRMANLVEHAASHGVKIVGLPLGGNKPDQWVAFEKAAAAHPDMLFIVSAGNNGRDIDQQAVYPAALELPNMLVVTSADDFGRLAQGVNWGRESVDYMLPAEHVRALRFDGSEGVFAGSSYAVPRMMALAARWMTENPQWQLPQLLDSLRHQFADGAAPSQLAQGFVYDPQMSVNTDIQVDELSEETLSLPDSDQLAQATLALPLQVLILDSLWRPDDVIQVLADAGKILSQCGIGFIDLEIQQVSAPEYLRDLETGRAKTLMDAVRLTGPERRATVVFARDTLMSTPFDAEAFGRGNTRTRPWLTDSVWLTLALQDRAIALAHELFHVLVNSGDHSVAPDSLMLARTTGNNTRLTPAECQSAKERSLSLGLVTAL